MNDRKQQLKSVFDEVCGVYNGNRFFEISANHLYQLSAVKKNDVCLDISTGTGLVACKLAGFDPGVRVDAIDLSSGMLEQASKNANALGLNNITFTEMDAEKLQFPKASFDVLSCGYGLFFLPNMIEAFQNMLSLLKPGGRFVFSSFTPDAFSPYDKLFLERVEKYGVSVPDLSWKLLKTQEQIEQLCTQAGVSNIRVVSRQIRYPISVDDWWSLLNSAGYKGLINQISKAHLQQFKEEHMSEIAELGALELNADSLYAIVEAPI